jgi:hypothetical protein
MSSQMAMSIMSGAEFFISAALGYAFWKRGLRRRFPGMAGYLALRVASTPLFALLLIGEDGRIFRDRPFQIFCAQLYFILFWGV